MMPRVCKNYTDPTAPPGCLMEADDRYTMDFSVIGMPSIYWCSNCGPQAKAIDEAISDAIENRPGFADKFKNAIGEAMDKR